MQKLIYSLFLVIIMSSCTKGSFGQAEKKYTWSPTHYLVVNCNIYNSHGDVLKETSMMGCLFLEDGRMFGKKKTSILMYDRFGKVLWEKNIAAHHISNFIRSNSQIILLASERKFYQKQNVRFDAVLIIDFNGNIINEWHVYDNVEELKKIFNVKEGKFWDLTPPFDGAIKEFSHANSVYEIQDNELSKRHPAFSRGNFIINLHGVLRGAIVLSHDLKSILWSSKNKYNMHDVQFMPNGQILLFRNRDHNLLHTTVEEIDPITEKKLWSYGGESSLIFYSSIGGSVQKLDNQHYLIGSNGTPTKVLIVNQNKKIEWEKNLTLGGGDKFHIERVQILDLGSFLKNNTL